VARHTLDIAGYREQLVRRMARPQELARAA
jgi:hypothetical protein